MSSNIATMASLFVEITRLLDGEDPTLTDISFATLDRLVNVAQRRIYGDVRSRWNEKAFTTTAVTGNLAPLPDDFEVASIVHLGRRSLIPVDENVIRDYSGSTGGTERYFAHAGNNFTFWPPIADGTLLQGRYYARLADLTDANIATNALFQNADDLFVYASLVESAPFFGASSNMALWEAKYDSIVNRVNKHNHRAAYSAGRLRIRPSASICGSGGSQGAGSQGVDAFALAEDGAFLGID